MRGHIGWRSNLLLALAGRELAARYRGSIFGWLWPIIVQVAQLLVFTYLFSAIFHVRAPVGQSLPAGPLSYGLWLFSALVSWNALQLGVMGAATTVIGQPNLVKKVAFPLALLPLVPVLAALVEACAGFLVLFALLMATSGSVAGTIVLIPLLIVVQFLLTAGVAYIVAALTTVVRDIPQTLGPLFLLLFYLTPIVYPASAVPHRFAAIEAGNPLRVLIESYRALIFGSALPLGPLLAVALLAVLVFLAGWLFFKRLRPTFPDVI